MPICTNLMKIKFKCIKWSRFEKLFFTKLLRIHSSFFYIFFYIFFEFSKISN
jgi:hypothetical protein